MSELKLRPPKDKEPAGCRRYGLAELKADPSPPFATISMPAWHRKRDRVRDDSKAAFYLFGSYRIATAPEPNSSRLTSLKSTRFDSPANKVGPWPSNLGCTTNSYSSINPSSANASGSVTPPTNSPLPDSRLSS